MRFNTREDRSFEVRLIFNFECNSTVLVIVNKKVFKLYKRGKKIGSLFAFSRGYKLLWIHRLRQIFINALHEK